jgi:hypothetical protein
VCNYCILQLNSQAPPPTPNVIISYRISVNQAYVSNLGKLINSLTKCAENLMEANCKQQQQQQQQQQKKPLPDNKLDVKNADSHHESSKYCLYLRLDLYYVIMYASCKCFLLKSNCWESFCKNPIVQFFAATIKVHRIKLPNFSLQISR